MSAIITMRTPAGPQRSLALDAGETTWFTGAGEQTDPAEAHLCVFPTPTAVWAIIAPAADAVAAVHGRPVMGGLLNLLEAPLTVGAVTWTARAADHGPQPGTAPASARCPVCHLPIESGAEVYVCGCGVITDSRFCATGGASDASCFACGASVRGGVGR